MLKGSCHCGKVRYEIRGELGAIVCCHCSQCRKSQGSAFATNAPVKARDFHWLDGEESISEYPTPDDKIRAFCQHCGSPIYSQLKSKPEILRLRIGTLDTAINRKPSSHIFTGSKAEWYDILDELPQHTEREPGR